ncbi:MAG: class I SAM-dependent methyltransferase [Burkholderiales bacterium]
MAHKPYYPVVLSILRDIGASSVLDAACGSGWLGRALEAGNPFVTLDGVDLHVQPSAISGYRSVTKHNLDVPAPPPAKQYDVVVCCEAIHLLTNPGVALASFARSLHPGGTVIITTPNVWYMSSRLQFFLRGFHSGFRPHIGKTVGQDYVTYLTWTFPQLHQFLTHYGFSDIRLHDVDEPKPKHWIERVLATPSRLHLGLLRKRSKYPTERRFWSQALSRQAMHGRWLVVSATYGRAGAQ